MPSYRTGLFLDPKGRGAVTGACVRACVVRACLGFLERARMDGWSIWTVWLGWSCRLDVLSGPQARQGRAGRGGAALVDRPIPSLSTHPPIPRLTPPQPQPNQSPGYDMAVALPGLQNSVEGDEELFKENNKTFDITQVRACVSRPWAGSVCA